MPSRLIVSLLYLACGSLAAAGTVSLTVDGTASFALKHNPALAAARLRIEEARGRLHQSGRLSNPELELELARHTRGREGSASVALLQRFPLTARLRLEKAVSRAELAAAEAEVKDAERKLASEVRTAAVKLLALRGQRDLRAKQLAHSRELSDFLSKRVAAGEASAIDASQVELESRQIEVESLTLAADEAVLLGELRPLLGIGRTESIAITGTLPSPQSIPEDREVLDRADIVAAESRAKAARFLVLEQRARRWDDIGIGASYSRDRTLDAPEPIETEQIIGFRFSLSLPLWNSNAGRIQEAEAAAARAEKEVEATRLNASAELTAALGALRSYARLIEELDTRLLPTATRIEEQLRANYAAGLTALTDVLRARTRRLELERQHLDALRDYHLALIRHSAALGQPTPISATKK